MEREERVPVVDGPFGIFNIELTNRCPMRCVMCPRTKNMKRRQGFMKFELFSRLIDELVQTNEDYINHQPVWLHHFGESLLHPEFGRFIQYAVKKEVVTCLSLNPMMLTHTVSLALLKSKPQILYISLDGHDDTSFQKIRGVKNAYAQSLENLQNFLTLKQSSGSDCRIVLSMIDFNLNRQSIAQTRSHWESAPGVDEFLMKSFSTWDGDAADINCLEDDSQKESTVKSGRVECNFPWERMTVLWDGEVVPCCNDYDKKLSLGNFNHQTLSEIWNGHEMTKLREEFISGRVTNPLCHHCEKLRLPREQWDW
ncbi:MAG: radical SAM protein [Deltaproteobacteria bacterium]|nr:radical SAM protein [Deltaproteobacteria bacterium]